MCCGSVLHYCPFVKHSNMNKLHLATSQERLERPETEESGTLHDYINETTVGQSGTEWRLLAKFGECGTPPN